MAKRIDNGTQGTIVESPLERTNESDIITDGNGEPEIIAGYESIEPANIGSDSDSSGTGKRRGRPRGSKNNTVRQTPKKNLEGIETLLFSLHAMGASILKTPELIITPEESKQLGEAVQRVAEFYPVNISPKIMAWVHLSMVAGGIYGTRLVAIQKRLIKDAAPKRPPRGPGPPNLAGLTAVPSKPVQSSANGIPEPEATPISGSRPLHPSELMEQSVDDSLNNFQ